MAFNPFHRFRKHQKAFFAVLTIVCMIVFIFQFGAGDVFQRALGWFGAGRGKGQLVAKINGTKIYESDLAELLHRRQMANGFMMSLAMNRHFIPEFGIPRFDLMSEERQTLDKMTRPDFDALKDRDPNDTGPLALAARIVRDVLDRRKGRETRSPTFSDERRYQEIRQDINLLTQPGLFAKNTPKEKQAVTALLFELQFEAYQVDPSRKRMEMFFGGTNSTEELLDFQVWLHQADVLGIMLGEPEIIKSINSEFGYPDYLTSKSFVADPLVVKAVGDTPKTRNRSITATDLLKALTDEYRVVLAKEALLGQAPGFLAYRPRIESASLTPAAATPAEFYDYFKRQRTALNLAVLPVAVSQFEKEVGQPSESDLQRLFDKYQKEEPRPDRVEPGFTIPRRVRIEYVTAKPDLPFYTKAAWVQLVTTSLLQSVVPKKDYPETANQERVGLARIVLQTALPLSGYAAGGGVIPWAVHTTLPLAKDRILAAYLDYVESERKGDSWLQSSYTRLHDVAVFRSETLTSLAGQAAGLPGTGAGLLALPMLVGNFLGSATLAEAPERARVQAAAVVGLLQPLVPTEAAGRLLLNPEYLYQPPIVSPGTWERVNRFLDDKVKVVAKELLTANLETLKKELEKRKGKPEEARAYLKEALKTFGLEDQVHVMADAKDKYALEKDPAMAPFKKAFDEAYGPFSRKPPEGFAGLFFGTGQDYTPQGWSATTATTGQSFFWSSSSEPFLFWRIEDIPPKTPASLDKARDRVTAAWKLIQAREQALQKVRGLNEEVAARRARGDAVGDNVKFLRDQKLGEVFELSGENAVTRMVEAKQPIVAMVMPWEPYKVPADKIAYPLPDFVDRVMKLQEKGDSMYMPDLPQRHFYLILLLQRTTPSLAEFIPLYSGSGAGRTDPIWQGLLMGQLRQQYQQRLMTQLRQAAAGSTYVDASGEWILPEGVKARPEGREDME
jgi:hypothetical protein